MDFAPFFKHATNQEPYRWQERLAATGLPAAFAFLEMDVSSRPRRREPPPAGARPCAPPREGRRRKLCAIALQKETALGRSYGWIEDKEKTLPACCDCGEDLEVWRVVRAPRAAAAPAWALKFQGPEAMAREVFATLAVGLRQGLRLLRPGEPLRPPTECSPITCGRQTCGASGRVMDVTVTAKTQNDALWAELDDLREDERCVLVTLTAERARGLGLRVTHPVAQRYLVTRLEEGEDAPPPTEAEATLAALGALLDHYRPRPRPATDHRSLMATIVEDVTTLLSHVSDLRQALRRTEDELQRVRDGHAEPRG